MSPELSRQGLNGSAWYQALPARTRGCSAWDADSLVFPGRSLVLPDVMVIGIEEKNPPLFEGFSVWGLTADRMQWCSFGAVYLQGSYK